MFKFILILLFSETVLLTPNYIDINADMVGYKASFNPPLTAITSGASIRVDVSSMLSSSNNDLFELREEIDQTFKHETIEAVLSAENKKVKFIYDGSSSISGEKTFLILNTNQADITELEFSDLFITTSIPLKNIKIYWQNFQK